MDVAEVERQEETMIGKVKQRYRPDGWPLCPCCDEDELRSAAVMKNAARVPGPTLAECFADEFTCYNCGWRGRVAPEGSK